MFYSAIALIGLSIFLLSSINVMFADSKQQQKKFISLMIMGAVMLAFPLIPMMQLTPVSSQVAKLLDVEEEKVIVEDLTEDSGFLGFGPSRNDNLRRIHVNGKTYIAELNGFNVEKITEEK